jgi:uncharacterized protein (TIGR03086 family)
VTVASERYRRVASGFSARVDAVPSGAWDLPAPCEGWVARDVVDHLVTWIPGFFFATWGIDAPDAPGAVDDPAGAWHAHDSLFGYLLEDPDTAGRVRESRFGLSRFDETFDTIATNDVFLHTWDLARAAGLDERLDPDEVHRLLVGLEPMDEALRASGHYGPRVAVRDGAEEQTRLLAFIGRRP